MNTRDLFRVLKDYSSVFREYAYVKSRGNAYMHPDNIKLEVVPEKWGWIPDEGARFLIRLYDMERPVAGGNILPEDQYDITPFRLLRSGKMKIEDIDSLSEGQPPAVRKSLDGGPWFQYYDEDHLRALLDKLLQPILDEAKGWISTREEARKFPPKIQRLTKEQLERIKSGNLSTPPDNL